jgi:hypothetical protein
VGGAGWRHGARADARGGGGRARGGVAGHVGWRRRGTRAGGKRERRGRETREVRDLGFWVKFDGVHVAHVFNLRMWVPTFLIG